MRVRVSLPAPIKTASKNKMKNQEFLEFVRNECAANKVGHFTSSDPRIYYDGMRCNGFFESEFPAHQALEAIVSGARFDQLDTDTSLCTPLLAYSRGGKTQEELTCLVLHEYCHMQQFLENSPHWVAADVFTPWVQWLDGVEVEQDKLLAAWRQIVTVEHDCEQRALHKARQLDLPIDRTKYIRRANAYLFFHSWALKNRKFYTKAPYEIPGLVNKMPLALYELPTYLSSSMVTRLLPLFDLCA